MSADQQSKQVDDQRARQVFQDSLADGVSFSRACLVAGVSQEEGKKLLADITSENHYEEEATAKVLQQGIRTAVSALEEAACSAIFVSDRIAAAKSLIQMRIELWKLSAKKVKKSKDEDAKTKSLWDFRSTDE